VRAAGSDSSLITYWSMVYYSEDRAASVTSFVVQWAKDSSFKTLAGENIVFAEDTFPVSRVADLQGRHILTHNITGLEPGVAYYGRVCSVSVMGRGRCAVFDFHQFATSAIVPRMKADAIPYGSVQMTQIPASDSFSIQQSSTSLKLNFHAPAETHGSVISQFKVEWWATDAAPEVKRIEVSGLAALSGTFRLAYNGDVTHYLPHDCSDDYVRTALEALADIRAVSVLRNPASSGSGFVWLVTFDQDFPSVDDRALTIDASGVRAASGAVTGAVSDDVSGALPHGYGSAWVEGFPSTSAYQYIITGHHVHGCGERCERGGHQHRAGVLSRQGRAPGAEGLAAHARVHLHHRAE
jgi:hypothetical protein